MVGDETGEKQRDNARLKVLCFILKEMRLTCSDSPSKKISDYFAEKSLDVSGKESLGRHTAWLNMKDRGK